MYVLGRQLTVRAVVRVRILGDDAERLGEVVRLDRVGETHPFDGCQREPTPTRGACYVAANRGMRESDDVLIYDPVLALGHQVPAGVED